MGQWDFNLRRGNLHLLDIINKYQGCIIVDSTRRGKRIPDSLSKTVPIWCCAINRAIIQYRSKHNLPSFLDPEKASQFHSLPSVVSRSEHAQIEERMDGFAQKLLVSKKKKHFWIGYKRIMWFLNGIIITNEEIYVYIYYIGFKWYQYGIYI